MTLSRGIRRCWTIALGCGLTRGTALVLPVRLLQYRVVYRLQLRLLWHDWRGSCCRDNSFAFPGIKLREFNFLEVGSRARELYDYKIERSGTYPSQQTHEAR